MSEEVKRCERMNRGGDERRQFIVGVLVNNHFGVLNRVAGLYAKRGYNIDSLAVGETEDPRFSRMTIVSTGDGYMREQVVKQLNKLHDVKAVVLFDDDTTVSVEHMLIKLATNSTGAAQISELVNRFSGKIKDFGAGYALVEITGEKKKINAFFEAIRNVEIIEMCRSGLISMEHGMQHTLREVSTMYTTGFSRDTTETTTERKEHNGAHVL